VTRVLSAIPPMAYAGRVNCVTGYGQAGRLQVQALRSHGARFKIVDTGSAGDPDPRGESAFVQSCRRSDPGTERPKGSILHMGPNMTEPWRRKLPRPHVLVSAWETTRLPASWVPTINTFDQVWCATQWQADVYAASGVQAGKIRHVPFALDPALYPHDGPRLPEVERLRAEGFYVFGSMFQWTERKAPRALIGAYLAAFHRGERVALVLKSYEGDDPATSVAQHVARIVAEHGSGPTPRIEVLSRRLSHDETLAFHRSTDCYVSPHRGEGFGLPIAEAVLLGRPVIATDWSAPAEYARGCYHPVPYTLVPPHGMDWQPFYTPDQRWADPDRGALAAWMRRAYAGDAPAAPPATVAATLGQLPRRAGEAARAALEALL